MPCIPSIIQAKNSCASIIKERLSEREAFFIFRDPHYGFYAYVTRITVSRSARIAFGILLWKKMANCALPQGLQLSNATSCDSLH